MAKKKELSIEDKLRSLYDLQLIDSRIDEIRNVRGELPLEVEDLEDDIAGLNTRLEKIQSEVSDRSNLQIMTENTENISKISLISTGSTTHAQSSELKFRFLEFNKISKKELSAKIDENRSSIQSGSYLVYLINDKGVPSEGKVVFIK